MWTKYDMLCYIVILSAQKLRKHCLWTPSVLRESARCAKTHLHGDNWLVAAATSSSDANFRQSADCQRLGSLEPKMVTRKRSFQDVFRSFFFLLLRSWCETNKPGNNSYHPKFVKPLRSCVFDFSELGGFASENLSLCMFPSSTCSLLSSPFAFHPAPLPHSKF